MWKGVIIEESLIDKGLLQRVEIIGTREAVLEAQGERGTFHFHNIVVSDADKHTFVAAASYAVKQGWYLHICRDDRMVVVFNDHIFEFSEKEKLKLESARKYGMVVGIPVAQLQFEHLLRHPHSES